MAGAWSRTWIYLPSIHQYARTYTYSDTTWAGTHPLRARTIPPWMHVYMLVHVQGEVSSTPWPCRVEADVSDAKEWIAKGVACSAGSSSARAQTVSRCPARPGTRAAY